MEEEGRSDSQAILPVSRSREEAKRLYDRISRVYDLLTGVFERKYAERALKRLSIEEGEIVLEIGFGSGHCLMRIAQSVGQTGKVYGIDISSGMLEVAKRKLRKTGLTGKAELYCGDAANLPYHDHAFDAVFSSFTMELFDTPEIPKVLGEIRRVLKPGGRLGVISTSKENGKSIVLRIYEWAHRKWPRYVDCRPIYVERSLMDAGYEIKSKEKVRLMGLPLEIVIAVKAK